MLDQSATQSSSKQSIFVGRSNKLAAGNRNVPVKVSSSNHIKQQQFPSTTRVERDSFLSKRTRPVTNSRRTQSFQLLLLFDKSLRLSNHKTMSPSEEQQEREQEQQGQEQHEQEEQEKQQQERQEQEEQERLEQELEEKLLKDTFGPLLDIDDESIVALVSNKLEKITGKKCPSTGRVVSRNNGSYNLVHVVEFGNLAKYVVRVPCNAWGGQFTETDQHSLTSQALAMRFIKKQTSIPIPEVYYFDVTQENEIGAPYILMGFVSGLTVNELWFEQTGPTPLEERRLRILDSLAKAMSQLQKFQFDKLGSLQFNPESPDDTPTIGPCYRWEEEEVNKMKKKKKKKEKEEEEKKPENADRRPIFWLSEYGPFTSSKSYLEYCMDNHGFRGDIDFQRGSRILTRMMIQHLPPTKKDSTDETFVLVPPDFNYQNIMADEQGNLTGIIDWDNLQTMPKFYGYSRYPSWLTRDWDPFVYHYPLFSDRENSPEELKRYRARYKATMQKMLRGVGDSKFTAKTHIFEAVCIAAADYIPRIDIVKGIVRHLFPEKDDLGAFEVLCDIAEGDLTLKEVKQLDSKFRALLSVPKYCM